MASQLSKLYSYEDFVSVLFFGCSEAPNYYFFKIIKHVSTNFFKEGKEETFFSLSQEKSIQLLCILIFGSYFNLFSFFGNFT